MIRIIDTNLGKKINFEITKFPDGTHQAWKINPYPVRPCDIKVIWMYEGDHEIPLLLQIGALLSPPASFLMISEKINLYAPYLPYGRQDKKVDNELTFAGHPIMKALNQHFKISCYDAHSEDLKISSICPEPFFKSVLEEGKYDGIIYPDEGAMHRYMEYFRLPFTFASKVREQTTGKIIGHEIHIDEKMQCCKKILIVDDICDGGATFISVVKAFKKEYLGKRQIDLAVSHGIFSKGKEILGEAGITNIFTTNSLLKNKNGFEVVNKEYIND